MAPGVPAAQYGGGVRKKYVPQRVYKNNKARSMKHRALLEVCVIRERQMPFPQFFFLAAVAAVAVIVASAAAIAAATVAAETAARV